MLTEATRSFDLLEWRTREQMAPHTFYASDQRAGLCVAPLDAGATDAWLRWAAVQDGAPLRLLQDLIAQQPSRLRPLGVRAIWAVDVRGSWLIHALRERGFRKVDEIVTYELVDAGRVASAAHASITPAAEEHVAALAALDARAFAAPWRYPEFVLRAAMSEAAVFAVALAEDRPAGYVLAIARADEAHVVRLAVDPQHGRRGIGSALLRHAVERLRAVGSVRITLNTIASLPAGRLYRRLGFRSLHIGVDVLRMDCAYV